MNLLSGIEQDFHRSLKTPGAYEWWHFDGEDEKSGYSFSIQFFAGNLFSPFYQDSLKTYWQKTKSPLLAKASPEHVEGVDSSSQPIPPNPLDYCGVALRVFHNGFMVGEALQEFSAKFLKASDQQGAVMLGPNRFNWDERGDPPSYVLTAQAPLRGGRKILRTRLFFTPLKLEFPTLPLSEIPSTHTWVLAAPLCHVEGTLEWCNPEGEVEKEQGFIGKGYHDHHFGTVPLDRFVKTWHWGRAFWKNEVFVYSFITPHDPGEGKIGYLAISHDKNLYFQQVPSSNAKESQKRFNFFFLPYKNKINLTSSLQISEKSGDIRISSLQAKHEKILSDGPAFLIFEDEIRFYVMEGNKDYDDKTLGMSNYLYTPRLSNRLFFPMLKGKTSVYVQREEALPTKPGDSNDVTTTRPAL